MSLLAFALALSCPTACAPIVLAPDAPSVGAARRWMQAEVDLAEKHNNDAEPGLVNVTTSVTPEAEHVPTGARCRFWYGSADIFFLFYNGRALSCVTRLSWVSVETTIYRREERPGIRPDVLGPESGSATATPRDVALARAASLEREAPRRTTAQISDTLSWLTPGGRRIPYVTATFQYPGGGPDRTRQRRHTHLYAALVGEWMLIYRSDGPIHYRAALDDYAEKGFGQLLASVEVAGRIMPPLAPAEGGSTP